MTFLDRAARHIETALPGLRLEGHEAAIAILLGILVALLVGRILMESGFSFVDAALLLLIAPLLVGLDHTFWRPSPTVEVAANAAGFGIPVLLSLKLVLTNRAPWGPAIFCTAVVTLVAYWSSYAIPGEGVLIHYRYPALAAALVALALRWRRWSEAGPVAYVGGALGVIIGADAFHLSHLLAPMGVPHRIILGGAGLFDGIFLVGLLSVALTTLAMAAEHGVRAAITAAEEADGQRAPRQEGAPGWRGPSEGGRPAGAGAGPSAGRGGGGAE